MQPEPAAEVPAGAAPGAATPRRQPGRRLVLQAVLGGSLAAASGASSAAALLGRASAPRGSPSAAGAQVRLGVSAQAGSVIDELAGPCAASLSRALGLRVDLQRLPADADLASWCARRSAALLTLLLVDAWQVGTQPVWHGNAALQAACRGSLGSLGWAQPLAVLARDPLVLACNRELPQSLPALTELVRAAPAGWRYGVDGSDALAAEMASRCLREAGLGAFDPVPFRGPAQLLPALAGDRLALTILLGPAAVAGPHCGPVPRGWAGNQGRWAAAQRAGDIGLLAVADGVRSPLLPGVPTLNEALGEPGHEAVRCSLLLAAPGWPRAHGQRLSAAAAALATPC